MSGLFDSFDQDKLDDVAGRMLAAFIAVVEFGRPTDDGDVGIDHTFFAAAVTKALLTALAAGIIDPHTDDEQDEEFIVSATDFLRQEVAALRAQS